MPTPRRRAGHRGSRRPAPGGGGASRTYGPGPPPSWRPASRPAPHRYGWPLLLTAVTAEADNRGLPTAAEARESAVRWAEVVEAYEPLARPAQLAGAHHRLADVLLAGGGRREEAAALLREAHAAAVRLGARPLREEVELLATRARLPLVPEEPRTPAEPGGHGFDLTPREQEVLSLVAAGRSNRRIAEELFISPKTASVHVSHILAKLGVAGRGEAAALAHRLRLLDAPP